MSEMDNRRMVEEAIAALNAPDQLALLQQLGAVGKDTGA